MKTRVSATVMFLCFVLVGISAKAQSGRSLNALAAENDSTESLRKQRVLAYCLKNNVSPKFTRNGKAYIMSDVTLSGVPVYEKTHNAGASRTVGVNELRTGGSLGINLTGTNMRVGVWDGGRVKNDHVELNGRITVIDGSSDLSTHATHVTGTILASGINASAKGMAPNASALSYDFSNDLAEMIAVAKPDQTTLLFSNHSYGTVTGWEWNGTGWDWAGDPSISTTEDYKFGFYDSRARAWDNLCFSAPYYTIVKSAGNDRGDTGDGSKPPDNDFNSVSTYGNAKNIITVGAVNKIATSYTGPASVIMSSFSSWGPTDDGRIKPDICAPGVNIFSSTATSITSYGTLDGTSMSSPVVTGSLTLLQQLYQQLNQNYLRAATLKALAIHTAKEAGSQPGPDYRFGWGLLDDEAAAKVILNRDGVNTQMIESTLANGQTFELELMPAENQKITATLVWTDPAGNNPPASLNPTTLMLVNDLDMKIVDDSGNEQLPWILNPASPNAAATRGNNFRDNVEKIEFDSPQPIKYYLRISHKNQLVNNSQNFSLVLTYTSTSDQHVTYYWIGGSGNWNSPAHWSLTSGGTSAGSIPTADDRVIVDENSSATDGVTITLPGASTCYSLYWLTSKGFNLDLNNQDLSIHENVLITGNSLTISTPGTFAMTGEGGNYTFNSAQPDLENLNLHFEGASSHWKFLKDIHVNSIILKDGEVDVSGLDFQVNTLEDQPGGEKNLDLTGTTLSSNQDLNINLSNGTSVVSTAASIIETAHDITLAIGSEDFAGEIILANTSVTIDQAGSVGHVSGKGTVIVHDDVLINNLDLDAGSTVKIQSGKTLTLTNSVTLQSTAGNPINIQNEGAGKGIISIPGNYRLCFDNLAITNVDFTGSAVVAVGTSTVINSAGWTSTTCDNLLFADFTFRYNCEGSYLYLTNTSSGNPDNIHWLINGTEVSTDQNIYVKIEDTESVLVHLDISKGVSTESYEVLIPVVTNTLPSNHLVFSEDRLYSFVQSTAYQWLLNHEVIAGETGRFIVYTDQPGDYSVLIFDETCNRESDPFLITGTESFNAIKSVNLYPNPTRGNVYLSTTERIGNVYAYDMLGKRHAIGFTVMNDQYEINVSGLPEGVYILRFITEKNKLIAQGRIFRKN
ncbi:MAG: S8 family serine peptidase [Cyclobacteriaceae bacterium]|nr:S8 family serine peptidase [Cyclobacteriaceae bacterium]